MTATLVRDEEQQFVAFHLGNETYALPIMSVNEIIRPCDATALPRSAEYMRGLINLRGKIVPVIDLRKKLGLAAAEESGTTRIIVVEAESAEGGCAVGLMVDAVSRVMTIPTSAIEQATGTAGSVDASLTRGIGKVG